MDGDEVRQRNSPLRRLVTVVGLVSPVTPISLFLRVLLLVQFCFHFCFHFCLHLQAAQLLPPCLFLILLGTFHQPRLVVHEVKAYTGPRKLLLHIATV